MMAMTRMMRTICITFQWISNEQCKCENKLNQTEKKLISTLILAYWINFIFVEHSIETNWIKRFYPRNNCLNRATNRRENKSFP